ncbi:signal peptide containing protein [Theileria equi strain WA]|uniref:Signal peptide containing protein n=1 Tax=Theileria equi strain WA TaxID=1537102 RepID=L1LEE2_THEEQ|nr:signal peptide containing protein [Theileria equi strain WA]EKX73654.1 signal peptide containing protein [Theileria equi strain WA]|eukprot:XP_004833106.1 signal peptide containing protein [Theileria equi strain WA]
MKANLLSVITFLFHLCSCGNVEEDRDASESSRTPLDVSLDITNINPLTTNEYTDVMYGAFHTSFFPKNHPFGKITDGKEEIWTHVGDERCTVVFLNYKEGVSRLNLHILSSTGSEIRYYERKAEDNSGWKSVQERPLSQSSEISDGTVGESDVTSDDSVREERKSQPPAPSKRRLNLLSVISRGSRSNSYHSERQFEEVPPQTPVGATTLSILDLTHPDASICTAIDVNITGILSRVYIIRPKTEVKMIISGNYEIWEGAPKERCTFCISFFKNGKQNMVLLRTKASFKLCYKFYKFKENPTNCVFTKKTGWYLSTKKYIEKINKLRIGTVARVSLDISSENEDIDKYVLTVDAVGGLVTRYYATRNGFVIGQVSYEHEIIWEGKANQACFLAELHLNEDIALLKLYLRQSELFSSCCFKKREDEWKKIDYKTFDRLLDKALVL